MQAIAQLCGNEEHQPPMARACDWADLIDSDVFSQGAAISLLLGIDNVELPTCPDCAVMVDQALESRGAP